MVLTKLQHCIQIAHVPVVENIILKIFPNILQFLEPENF